MRALVVDDSSFMRKYLREQLWRLGIPCAEASNGWEALEALRVGERFDLMLMDVNMPVMNGIECLKQVRAERLGPEMRVMMVTSEADNSFVEHALEIGADEFLMKPFTGQGLKEKLELLGFAHVA